MERHKGRQTEKKKIAGRTWVHVLLLLLFFSSLGGLAVCRLHQDIDIVQLSHSIFAFSHSLPARSC